MAKYLAKFKYTHEGVKGFLEDGGTKRRQATEQLALSLGGRVESYYFAFGEEDGFAILDMPDNISAAAASLIVSASGAVSVSITVLITPEEIDQVVKRKGTYRPPGK